jgi:glutaminyl-peptide cyclotransferase
MSKKRAKRSSFPDHPAQPSPSNSVITQSMSRPIRWELVILFLVISIGGSYLVLYFLRPPTNRPQFTFRVAKTYPHDVKAFTQGLLYQDGFLWESTGKKGQSSFRKVNLETGEVLQQVDLPADYFGEGLAYLDGKFYQLTWKSGVCLVYNTQMEKIAEFHYEGEGWGLTTDGTHLILSDGSSVLRFMDPRTFEEKHRIYVRLGGFRAAVLNELEYVDGKVFANVWMQDVIYEIDPKTGEVTNQISLEGLWPLRDRPQEGVLNGIAFNPHSRRLMVTGKYAPKIWEIDVVPIQKAR